MGRLLNFWPVRRDMRANTRKPKPATLGLTDRGVDNGGTAFQMPPLKLQDEPLPPFGIKR